MRYRGIVWSCPAHYYANFSNWLANCWGINILVEMESLNFTKPLETEDPELALLDLARLYERMVMRRHTNGGYQNVVDELWRQCEAWNANIIIMYQNVKIAAIVSITLIGTVILSKLLGCMLPMLAKKIHIDPAIMSAPLLSTLVDSCSTLLYFTIAMKILNVAV